MDRVKKAVKVTKKKTEKKKAVKKKTTQIGKQVGKVKTGAVVQIDLSRRTTARKQRNTQRADALQTGLLPLLMGIQSQSVASASNIERLQMERDRLRQQIQNEAVKRVDAVREGRPLQAHDAHERQRKAQTAERRTQTEINVKSAEQPLSAEMGVQVEPKKEEFMSAISSSRGTQAEPVKVTQPAQTETKPKPKKELTQTKPQVTEIPPSRIDDLIKFSRRLEELQIQVAKARTDMERAGKTGGLILSGKELQEKDKRKIRNDFSKYNDRIKQLTEAEKKKYKLIQRQAPSLGNVKEQPKPEQPPTKKIKISKGKGKK